MDIKKLDDSHAQQTSAIERRFEGRIEAIKRQKVSETNSLEKRQTLERERLQLALDRRDQVASD